LTPIFVALPFSFMHKNLLTDILIKKKREKAEKVNSVLICAGKDYLEEN